MATDLEIIRAISQAVGNMYDGAHDERLAADDKARTAGLKREQGDVSLDSRQMDGFNVRLHGNKLCIKYHSEMKLKDLHEEGANKFQSGVEQHLADIASYLKREYKSITKNTLGLTKDGEADIRVEHMSNIRSWVTAVQYYTIGSLNEVEEEHQESSEDRLDKAIKNWLSLGDGPKPKNVTRSED